jgi:hypothetical protein
MSNITGHLKNKDGDRFSVLLYDAKLALRHVPDGVWLRQYKAVFATAVFFIFVMYETRIDPGSERPY